MKLSNYVADFVSEHAHRVYSVCGAGAMHLNDSLCHHAGLQVIAMHHEQAAAMAAEAEARVTNRIGAVCVTAGPGGTNAVTGIAAAYIDSIPMLILAGQCTTNTMVGHSGCRQLGMNELDMVAIVQPITKYAYTVTGPFMIRRCLEHAVHLATSGRPGPVWIEIPLDVQAAEIDPDALNGFTPETLDNSEYIEARARETIAMLNAARRPVLLIGNGIRLAGACDELTQFVNMTRIPVVSSWTASDIIPTSHPCYVGRCGIFGDRAANATAQKADLLLAIGTRLSVPQTGHHPQLFAPHAKKIVVDIDVNEAMKPTICAGLPVVADARDFLSAMLNQSEIFSRHGERWSRGVPIWKLSERERQPVTSAHGVNAYHFIEELAELVDDDAIIVTDVGFAFIPTMQTFPVKSGQRLFHSGGVSAMGSGLPAAIGACLAGEGRQVVCLVGDGGMTLNLQELQTIAHHNLKIAIFVYANDGYATIQLMQDNHFKRRAISSEATGLGCPDLAAVADGFGVTAYHASDDARILGAIIENALTTARNRPVLCVLPMAPGQVIAPRVQSRVQDGKFVPTPLDEMWPPLAAEKELI